MFDELMKFSFESRSNADVDCVADAWIGHFYNVSDHCIIKRCPRCNNLSALADARRKIHFE